MNDDNKSPQVSSEFMEEIMEDLEHLESALLEMENKGAEADDDLINRAFRAIHSIKGGAGFLGLEDLSRLSHSMENVLMQVREHTLVITADVVDALLAGFDKLGQMAGSPEAGGTVLFQEELDRFDRIRSGQTGENEVDESGEDSEKPAPKASAALPGDADPALLKAASDKGNYLYLVHVKAGDLSKRDIPGIQADMEQAGEILYSRKEGEPVFILATILEPEFLVQVLELPEDRIVSIDADSAIEACDKPDPGAHREKESEVSSERSAKETADEGGKVSGAKSAVSADKSGPKTVRINVELLTRLMNRAGELVLSRNQLRPFIEQYAAEDESLNSVMQNLNMVTTEIQEDIMQMRMQPVAGLFSKFKRTVRDTARALEKKVEYATEGGDTELDRNVIEHLTNPFTHLIRNCVDHGLESPADRVAAGKPETGVIRIKAFHQGGHVHIRISDDGSGIDPEKVAPKAVEKELVSAARVETMTDREKVNLIFAPGFSTTSEITDVSGRGVGMDVVKSNLEKIRGTVEIDSEPGAGTTVHLIIPLTLAIIPALIIESGELRFAVPQVNVSEVFYYGPGDLGTRVERIRGAEVLRLRDTLVPVVRLGTVLGMDTFYTDPETGEKRVERRNRIVDRRQETAEISHEKDSRTNPGGRRKQDRESGYIVIVKTGVNLFGLCVDDLHDNEEIVVEPLSDYIKECRCFSGATILGDGRVIMILDVGGIASLAGFRFDAVYQEEKRRLSNADQARGPDEKQRMLVFNTCETEFFAARLESVRRLELVESRKIKSASGLCYMEYNGKEMTLFALDELMPACSLEPAETEYVYVIIPKHMPFHAGVIVKDIQDIMEVSDFAGTEGKTAQGILDKFFLEDTIVQVLDMEWIGEKIGEQMEKGKEMQ